MTDHNLNTSPEVFKPIPGFPGYEVSDRGKVRSYWKTKGGQKPGGKIIATTPQRILRGKKDHGGYICVSLHNCYRGVHTLVLTAFVGTCPPGMECCHGDGIRAHNWLSNLRWDTYKHNHQDRRTHETDPLGERNGRAKLTETQLIQIRNLTAQDRLSQKEIGKIFGVSQPTISAIITRRSWKHLP